MNVILRRAARFGAAVVAAVTSVACQAGPASDKSGGDTVVLTLASIDKVNANGQSYGPQAFVDGLAQVSGGRLKVVVKEEYGAGAADAESQLVRAIAAGQVDGGWPATRAFAGADVAGLAVVEAPMLLASYAAERDLVSGPVAGKLLTRLAGSGVIGLGLAVGPLRRPFAADGPLLALEDWQGIPFRVFNSPTQTAAVQALGATPVNAGFGWIDQIRTGDLRGAEFDIAQYAANSYGTEAGNVTANVVLWPKVFVLSLSQARFDKLSARQQDWVRQAAARAVKASVDATYDETALARQLCTKGVRFRAADNGHIAALRAALRPVQDKLGESPADTSLLGDLRAIAARHPAPEPLDVPAACRQGVSLTTDAQTAPTTVSAIPEGVYRAEITAADVAAAGISNNDGLSGTWTLRIRRGTYELSCRPLANPGRDCGNETYDGPLDVGDLRGTGHTVHFVYRPDRLAHLTGCKLPVSQTAPGHCFAGQSYAMDWAVAGDRLTFSNYVSSWTNDQYLIEPWRKIA